MNMRRPKRSTHSTRPSRPIGQELQRGFTLLEIAVVIALLGVLTAISLKAQELVEQYRQGLNQIWRGTQPGTRDHGAVSRLIDFFDDWLDNYPYRDPDLQGIRATARGLHAEERQLFGRRGQRDAGGQAVERILETGDMTGKSVIDTVLGTDIGARQSALGAVRRIKEAVLDTRADGTRGPRPGATRGAQAFSNDRGTIPPELQSLREAAIYRILAPLERATGEAGQVVGEIPYGTIRTNFLRALADDGGGPIMAELFRPDELVRMRNFVRLIEQITPPAGTVNYSNTSYEGARMIKDAFQNFVEGVLGGGPAVVFNTLWSAPKNALQAASARQALTRQTVAVPMQRSPQGVAALSGYATLQNQDDAYGP
jgi:prepilin-type N-terminal cleavage/methylation domain-containing protein